MRRIIAVVLLALFVLAQPTVASTEEIVALDGYCEDGVPVLNRPLLPGEHAECDEVGLWIDYPPQDLSDDMNRVPSYMDLHLPDPDVPGFAYWVTLELNKQWYIAGQVTKERKEPQAFLIKDTGRVVMPIRFFTEAIGGNVWYSLDGTIQLQWHDTNVLLKLGEVQAIINGEPTVLDQPPLLVSNRTLVPTRFVMEAFGADITWDSRAGIVKIQLDGAICSNAELCHAKEQ